MKIIITTLILGLSAIASHSQTKLIAFKSHSGNLAYFTPSSNHVLGLPSFRIDTVIKVDSSIVEIGGRGSYGWGRQVDTIKAHPYCYLPEYTLKDLKSSYPYDVIFLGFDKKKDAKAKKETAVIIDNANPSLLDTQVDSSEQKKMDSEILPVKEEQDKLIIEKSKEKIKSKSERSSMIPILLIVIFSLSTTFGIYFWKRGKEQIIIE